VALDTQRRGRGIHVLTFHCSNIAGYGPRDPDERSQNTVADLDIDGMLGIMKLVDEVRNRVPGVGSITNTVPRVPRVAPTPQPTPSSPMQRTGSLAPITTSNGNSLRAVPGMENASNAVPPRNAAGIYPQSTGNTSATPSSIGRTGNSAGNNATSPKSVSYTDKIRAVLYPNQRNWSAQGSASTQAPQEQPRAETMQDNSQVAPTGANNFTVLQRLANGQASGENQGESGLAQLSRLAQANYTTTPSVQYESSRDTYQQQQQMNTPPIMEARFTQSTIAREQSPVMMGAVDYAPAASPDVTISTQPLRASPIQDIPVDRPGNNPTGEVGRRPDVLARINHGQQQTLAALPPLASIATPTPIVQASGTLSAPSTSPIIAPTQMSPAYAREPVEDEQKSEDDQPEAQVIEKPHDNELEDIGALFVEPTETQPQNNVGAAGEEADMAQNRNTMLFDIMQSLPPMPPVGSQSQTVQPQVLSGRATRSLGSVLLAGHLVPQNRLEVAQNIQRMLRGVDLNYQLGEILLMFKLLTPDQLLAASLVSYGMITTTQVSALGRIRQELHSIGLEYDLESLLILFRILTPEQLREAKSGMQG
jgi:hypothetical protein